MVKFENILQKSKNGLYYDNMGNARLVRNIIEKALLSSSPSSGKPKKISREDLLQIKPEDIAEVEDK